MQGDVLDEAQSHRDLAAATLACPGCAGRLGPWGFARVRSLRPSSGGRISLRPRRARCMACAVTHVLLPALAPARHAYAIDTVRGWISRVTRRAEWVRVQGTTAAYACDPMQPAVLPVGSALAQAVSALGVAAAAVRRLFASIATPWQIIAVLARGQLLAPLRSD